MTRAAGSAGLAAMLAAVAAGCGGGGPARTGPTPIAASPPAAYPLEREQPGGSVEAMPPEQAPVAKPLREDLPLAVVRELPSETATAAAPSQRIPVPPERTAVVPDAPHLDPSGGATIPLSNAILAEVNGDVITREEILSPLRPQIEQWKKNLSETDFQERCRYSRGTGPAPGDQPAPGAAGGQDHALGGREEGHRRAGQADGAEPDLRGRLQAAPGGPPGRRRVDPGSRERPANATGS